MSLLSSLTSLVTERRGAGRARRVSWPRPVVEELEPRWVPAAPVGIGGFSPGSVGGGFVPGTFSAGQTDLQTAALNPPVPNPGTAINNPAGTLGGTITQNGVVTNPANIAESLILTRVPILAATQPANIIVSTNNAAATAAPVGGPQQPDAPNANPLLIARTALRSGSGNDFASVFATDSELFRRGMRDFIERLPGVGTFPGTPPQAPPPPRLRGALPPSLREQTPAAEEVIQNVQQQAADPSLMADLLDYLSEGGSLVELEALLSRSGE